MLIMFALSQLRLTLLSCQSNWFLDELSAKEMQPLNLNLKLIITIIILQTRSAHCPE